MKFELLYSAAHAEFPDTEPLGGGKAVADYLIREWRGDARAVTGVSTSDSGPFALTVLSPKSLGFGFDTPLAQMRVHQYARFCRLFERAATAEILKRDPHGCVVLSNDISEGPDFAALGRRGYRIVTIFHVDVVEYFTKFYLRNLVRPETLARFRQFSWLPDVLRLVVQKQFECVRSSACIVVPSTPMRETIFRCYPSCPADKVAVLPWGNIAEPIAPSLVSEFPPLSEVGEDEFVILTLSRLSPEKGIERLLRALRHLDVPGSRLRAFICGGPAYMKGQRYARMLRKQAARFSHVRVEFPGHVTGAHKAALLGRADVFVSPSLHESYGLTIAEALSAGCRVISHTHYGASGTIVDCSNSGLLAQTILEMAVAGRTARATDAAVRSPSSPAAAEQLAELLSRAREA